METWAVHLKHASCIIAYYAYLLLIGMLSGMSACARHACLHKMPRCFTMQSMAQLVYGHALFASQARDGHSAPHTRGGPVSCLWSSEGGAR